MRSWPGSASALVAAQDTLATAAPPAWRPRAEPAVGGCFICFPRGVSGAGAAGDPAWAAAACGKEITSLGGVSGAPYEPGLLALREGPLLEAAVRALAPRPDVLLVNATGRDHPRRAGLALHLGAVLGVPTAGVTHRPLLATGARPQDRRGAHSPLLLEGEVVGAWMRTRRGRHPLAITPGWQIDLDTSLEIVLGCCRARTPEPLRAARHAARLARASSGAV